VVLKLGWRPGRVCTCLPGPAQAISCVAKGTTVGLQGLGFHGLQEGLMKTAAQIRRAPGP